MAERAGAACTDQALVARALLGHDRQAFEQLVRRHQGAVRAQLRRLLHGDQALADDLAQETFIVAWRKLDQFRGDARFSTWLYQIAHTRFLQAIRKKGDGHQGLEEGQAEGLEVSRPPVDLLLDLERAMRQLSSAEQTVLLYCVQLELSQQETADVLAMPLGTVKTHAARGKAKLQQLLAAWHPQPQPRKEE